MNGKVYCPICRKSIEWQEDKYGRLMALDPEVILFKKSEDGRGISVMTPLGEIMKGITVHNPLYAYNFGQRVHYCFITGKLRR